MSIPLLRNILPGALLVLAALIMLPACSSTEEAPPPEEGGSGGTGDTGVPCEIDMMQEGCSKEDVDL